ncbi:hypothetical protein E3E11_00525 [Oecophyllibacter saccharovorans]|uniref:Cupin domain-containing protein n=2 Tax=Oecophyllibacter saccharovorans TaxID=2558360 RepID=A0A506US39_9PROT|nr:hypothetical protein E3E11_00525 [Oecophyllibacter saccharovorans]TPW35325.1 hypothetical protein E3203_04510 [Oecophyllibacter saccharovorans]TPW36166.1 hypothetical protein E3202_01940 [Oecophyllibacter saccharovorans]
MMDGLTGGSFTVVDERAPDEISEVSRLYLNGRLAATFRLTLNHTLDETTLPVPVGRTEVPYALCGEITLLRNGRPVTHTVSSEGMLHHPDGQHYEAVGDNDFRDFFLVSYDDPSAADHKPGQSSLCVSPNA